MSNNAILFPQVLLIILLLSTNEHEMAKALEEGVLFDWDIKVRDVVLKSDSKIVVDTLIGISEAPVAIDNIIGKISVKLQDFRCVEISHVKRNGNRLAHLLAQYAKYLDSYQTWIAENPNMVESVLADDVLCLSSS